MKPQNTMKRALLKRNSRGAAMVEAAVILPLLAGFYGLFQFAHAEYDAKLVTMATAENDTSAYAAHACEGDEDVTPGVPDDSLNRSKEILAKAPADPAHQTSSKIFSVVNILAASPPIVARQATSTAKWSKYERTVTSRTWSFCNEENYEQKPGFVGAIDGFGKFVLSYPDNLVHHNR
ncbi:MAG: TadE/TadG family type IV pilus assembly protein [Polyangiaceae bacterium]